mmetsp:Transcript_41541/g.119890  ORF Transcript_41541/g.119890 Transcript_41541/m.119890 type:complete len:172 (+) Transcript_41541:118-633(+)
MFLSTLPSATRRLMARNIRAVLGLSALPSPPQNSVNNPATAKFSSICMPSAAFHTPHDSLTRCMSTHPSPGMDETESFITTTINDYKVVIFSKSYCPFCTRTKKRFRTLGEDALIFELDLMSEGAEIQSKLASMTGQRTVPNVFVNGTHVGGNDETHKAASSGKLEALLKG